MSKPLTRQRVSPPPPQLAPMAAGMQTHIKPVLSYQELQGMAWEPSVWETYLDLVRGDTMDNSLHWSMCD